MLNGLAQDIFHHPTEMNFYESQWQTELFRWAQYHRNDKLRPGQSFFNKYAEDELSWSEMQCSMEIKGCRSKSLRRLHLTCRLTLSEIPTPETVRKHISDPYVQFMFEIQAKQMLTCYTNAQCSLSQSHIRFGRVPKAPR
jgi:hypothetical protein